MALRPHLRTVKPLPLNKMHYTLTCIGVEAMAAYHPNIKIVNKLSDTYEGVVSYMSEQLKGLSNIASVLTMSKIDKLLQKYPYTEIMDIELPCISGQSADWNTMMSQFEHHLQLILEMPERIFQPFSTYVGSALNDPTKLNSVTFRSALRTTDTSKLRSDYGHLLHDGGPSVTTYGNLVSRNADWVLARTRLNTILEKAKAVPPELVDEKVSEINGVLRKLFKAIQDPSTNYQPTSVVISEFVKLIEGLAEEVTMYALFVNLINQANKAMRDGEAKLIKEL